MPIRATIVRPPVDVLHKFSKPVECLALGYVASALRQNGHEAVLLDGMLYDWSVEETADRVLATSPDLVGFTVVLNYFPRQVADISGLLRAGGFDGPIVVGGHSVSFFPERVLAEVAVVDAVICGEGEVPIQEIADAMASGASWTSAPGLAFRDGGQIRRTPVRRLANVSLLGQPARDLTQEIIDNDGLAAMSTSRGCYARCNFCSIPRFYGLERGGKGLPSGDWLGRHPADAANEVLALHDSFGLLELLIVDDEFFGGTEAGRQRAVDFGDRLAEAGAPVGLAMSFRAENADPTVLSRLRAGGLRHCFIGLESGLDEDLKLYGKAHSAYQNRRAVEVVKDLGLTFQPGFMMFHYGSSIGQLRRNMDFLREIGECKPVTVNSAVDPHFGTPLLRVMRRAEVVDDLGLRMTMRFKNPKVAVAKSIAAESAAAFQPYMNTIAAIQSAITYEWRRTVPGRSNEVRETIDRFEQRVNDSFVAVIDEALASLDTATVAEAGSVAKAAREDIDRVQAELDLARSMLLLYLQKREGTVRYRTQRDMMNASAGTRG